MPKRFLAGSLALVLVFPEACVVSAAAAPVLAPATWDSLEVKPDELRLGFSSPVKYHSFLTANPPRLVIELLDTRHNLPSKSGPGAGRYLLRVRSGQYELSPRAVSRLVAELSEAAPYQVSSAGNDLIVRLSGLDGGSPKAAEDALGAQELGAMAAVMGAASSDAPRREAAEPEPPPATAKFMTREVVDIMSRLPGDRVSLDFDNTDIKDIIKLMAAKAKINIISGPDVGGPLTLHLADVPFGDAFRTILTMAGLTTIELGDSILRVATPAALLKERGANTNITKVVPLKYQKADDVMKAVDAARTGEGRKGSTLVDKNSNSLILTEPIDSLIATERIVDRIDVRPQQVLIEVKFVEVQLNKGLDLGIQWNYFESEQGKALGKQGLTTIGGPTLASASRPTIPFNESGSAIPSKGTGVDLPANSILGLMTLGRVTNNYFLNVTLSAAASQGRTKLLSDPKIATLNNQAATITLQVSDPYLQTTVVTSAAGTTTSNSILQAPSGIDLKVTPVITADGRINMDLTPTVSETVIVPVGGGSSGPKSSSRSAHSVVLVNDGETIVIGGLIKDTLDTKINKIPFFGDIPVLGWLFKSKHVQRNRTELLIFVTPKILRD